MLSVKKQIDLIDMQMIGYTENILLLCVSLCALPKKSHRYLKTLTRQANSYCIESEIYFPVSTLTFLIPKSRFATKQCVSALNSYTRPRVKLDPSHLRLKHKHTMLQIRTLIEIQEWCVSPCCMKRFKKFQVSKIPQNTVEFTTFPTIS